MANFDTKSRFSNFGFANFDVFYFLFENRILHFVNCKFYDIKNTKNKKRRNLQNENLKNVILYRNRPKFNLRACFFRFFSKFLLIQKMYFFFWMFFWSTSHLFISIHLNALGGCGNRVPENWKIISVKWPKFDEMSRHWMKKNEILMIFQSFQNCIFWFCKFILTIINPNKYNFCTNEKNIEICQIKISKTWICIKIC